MRVTSRITEMPCLAPGFSFCERLNSTRFNRVACAVVRQHGLLEGDETWRGVTNIYSAERIGDEPEAGDTLEPVNKVNEMAPRQAQFVAEYLIDLNATRAAERAGYSPKTAYSQGQRLLKNVEVQRAIQSAMDKRADKLEITADRVLQEIAKLAFLDPRKFFEDDGSLKRIQDLDDDTAACIAGMEVTELFEGSGEQKHAYGLLKKVKIADNGQNLERLGRHLKLFTDKTEHSGNIAGLQLIHDCPRPKRDDEP